MQGKVAEVGGKDGSSGGRKEGSGEVNVKSSPEEERKEEAGVAQNFAAHQPRTGSAPTAAAARGFSIS